MLKIKKKVCAEFLNKFCEFIEQRLFFSGYIMKGFLYLLCNVS